MIDITKQYQTMECEAVVLLSDKGPTTVCDIPYPIMGYIAGTQELHCWDSKGVNPYSSHKNLEPVKVQVYMVVYKNGMVASFIEEATALAAARAHPEATTIKVEYTPGQRDF